MKGTETSVPQADAPLSEWLSHCEGLHPLGVNGIELGLERVKAVAQCLGLRFDVPVVTVAGTNGKGSTCAMLESILLQAGYRTGLYTSPHLVHFEERCRVNGQPVLAPSLGPHFAAVQKACESLIPNGEAGTGVDGGRGTGTGCGADTEAALARPLTYFEFTTLALLRRMQHEVLDVVILEVGLGGRLDAVNLVDTDCAILTSIDLDHTALLGPDRESIGREKAAIMRAGKPAVVSDPLAPLSVLAHARDVGADLWQMGRDFNFSGDKQQWSWAGRGRRYSGLAYPALRGANQLLNAAGALAALEALRGQLPVTAQAIRNGLAWVNWPGRFQIEPGQPLVVLDVAHNPHAVAALAENLDAMGFYPANHAVFGAMADKDLTPMLARMAGLIDHWHFCDLPTPRALHAKTLAERWRSLQVRPDAGVTCYGSPVEAFNGALQLAQAADRIVAFGSFYTVGALLGNGLPQRPAPHAVTTSA